MPLEDIVSVTPVSSSIRLAAMTVGCVEPSICFGAL